MAQGRDDDAEIGWYCPDPRAIQPFIEGDPLGDFHVKRSLAKQFRKSAFEVTTDHCFAKVIGACATVPRADGEGTWISPAIESVYTELHQQGFAHSVEAWQNGELVGGIYGVTIGGAFFGESMFSRKPYGSQVCMIHLIEHLRARRFRLFDVQFVNPHIEQFGVVEVPLDTYLCLLEEATMLEVTW